MQRCALGDPLDKNTDVGAINSAEQLERIETLVAAGEEEGAVRRTVACDLPERGYWFAPTLFTDVSPAHRIAVEEIFGPVVSMLTSARRRRRSRRPTTRATGSPRASGPTRARRRSRSRARCRPGVVWQNTYNHFDPTAAFGGFKESGFGREGGAAGLRPYVRVMTRLAVKKTYKLYVGGAFVRSESGRHDPALDREGSTWRTSRAPRARTSATP